MEEKKSKISKRCKRILAAVIGTAVVSTAVYFLSIGLRALLKSVNRGKAWNTVCEVDRIAQSDVTRAVLPDEDPEEPVVILDGWTLELPADPAGRCYPYDIWDTYGTKLRGAGYEVEEFDRDLVAHKDDITIYLQHDYYRDQMLLHVYVDRPTPEGGYTPDEVRAILANRNRCTGYGDRFDLYFGNPSNTNRAVAVMRERPLVDVTPDGMFERTGAQIFTTFTVPFTSGTHQVQQRFFVVRYGYAYEWKGRSDLCFADVTGDGNTELCMMTDLETFTAYPKTIGNGALQRYTLEVNDEDMPPQYTVPITSRSTMQLEGDEITAIGADGRRYKMVVENGSLVLIDRESGNVIR